jgi:hypothetical protein
MYIEKYIDTGQVQTPSSEGHLLITRARADHLTVMIAGALGHATWPSTRLAKQG